MKKIIKPTTLMFLSGAFLCFSFTVSAQQSTVKLSDALFKTLESHPGVKIEETKIEQQKGLAQKAEGEFDWYFFGSGAREKKQVPVPTREQENQRLQQMQQNAQIQQNEAIMTTLLIPFTPTPLIDDPIITEIEETTNQYSVGVTKKFRAGINITPSLSTYDYKNNTNILEPEANSEVALEIVIPLLRGFGTKNSGANELAAISGLNARQLLSKHNISEQIYVTTISFWNCLAAARNQEILVDTEKRAVEVYDLVSRFIKVGEAEPALIHEANAKLYQRRVDLRNSDLNVYEARMALALAMGYKSNEMSNAPLPAGVFPAVMDSLIVKPDTVEKCLSEALQQRGDYRASKIRVETEGILLHKARNDKKPRVDFTVKAGYTGFDDSDGLSRFHRSLHYNNAGPNFYAGIRAELPLFNDAARGEVLYRKSLVKEASLNSELMSSHIGSEVLIAIERLQTAVNEYQLAKQTEEEYREAADHENYKVREGESDLSDLINMEDRYYTARANRVNAERKYAITLARFQFVTGGLIEEEDEKVRVQIQSLMEPPLLIQSKE